MNKYLLMSAAAVLAGTSVAATTAEAHKYTTGTQAFVLTGVTSHGGAATFCDVFIMHWEGGLYANQLVDEEQKSNGCASSAFGLGAGLVGKDKPYMTFASDSDSIAAATAGPYEQITYGFEMDPATRGPMDGGTWGEIVTLVTTGGTVNSYEAAYGYYHFVPTGKHLSGKHPAITDTLKTVQNHAPLLSGPKIEK